MLPTVGVMVFPPPPKKKYTGVKFLGGKKNREPKPQNLGDLEQNGCSYGTNLQPCRFLNAFPKDCFPRENQNWSYICPTEIFCTHLQACKMKLKSNEFGESKQNQLRVTLIWAPPTVVAHHTIASVCLHFQHSVLQQELSSTIHPWKVNMLKTQLA